MFKLNNININTDKVNKKLVVISDIHYTGLYDKKRLEKIYNFINKLDKDFICIPGDIIENIKINDNDYFIKWLEKLALNTKVIISLGNHDLKEKKINNKCYYDKEYRSKIKNINNVYVLNNKGITIDNVYFYGLNLSHEYYYKKKSEDKDIMIKEIKNINNISNINYNILLCHSPIYINELNEYINNYNLVLSGHMHNGLMPPVLDDIIKNNYGLIYPSKKILPKYARGVVKNKYNYTVISSGTTKICNIVKYPLKLANNLFPIGVDYITLTNNPFKIESKYIK